MFKNPQKGVLTQPHQLICTLLLIVLTSNSSWSQIDRFIRTYHSTDPDLAGYNYSVHGAYQYCTPLCYRGHGRDEYIVAGTYGIIDPLDSQFYSKGIHFMHLDHNGAIKQCRPTASGYGPASFVIRFDQLAFNECVATFNLPNSDQAFVVSQLHYQLLSPNAAINVSLLNNCSGAITWNKTLSSPNRNLYMMDAGFATSNEVFMTGFSTNTSGSDKKILFIKYDVAAGSFDAVEINTTTSTELLYDFDMGLTVRMLSLTPYQRYPMIVGSCNSDSGSASLALILNRTSLQVEDIISLAGSNSTHGEYAFDFDEISDNGGGYIIFSNKYKQIEERSAPLFFRPKALHPMISYVDKNENTYKFRVAKSGVQQRWHIRSSSSMPDTSWAWGTHIDVDDRIMSGIVAYRDPNASNCNLNGNTIPTMDEPVPFMTKLSYRFDDSLEVFTLRTAGWWWRQYHSSMSRNLYSRMRSQLNNMLWPNNFSFHNRFADTPTWTPDYVLLASNYEFNKLKAIRTNASGRESV